MQNIARFLFRILFFCTSCRKKTAGGALRWVIYRTRSEISLNLKFEMSMVQIRSDAPYPYYLVVEQIFFHYIKRNTFDQSIRTFHILLYVTRHPIKAEDLAMQIRVCL